MIRNNRNYLGIVFVLALMIFSCDTKDEEPKVEDEPKEEIPADKMELLDPVETLAPNTDYQPAFDGQTRVSGVRTQTEYVVTAFAVGLSNAWGMANLPDGRIIVTQKNGTLRIVGTSGSVGEAIAGLPKVNNAGQGGLLDVAVDPHFESNRLLYWTFSQNGEKGTATAVGKGRLSDDETTVEEAEVIYVAVPEFNSTAHYGSRIEWDRDDHMFISTGERSNINARPMAQVLTAALGKVLRITRDGEPVESNPFFYQDNALSEIYSYGHRNVQGLAIHPVTGELWQNELGPRGGDELNVISPGLDYGWPSISYGIEYNGNPIGNGITQMDGMEQPVYYWDPVVSPSGMTFYSGDLISEWQNNLFIAALSGKHVIRLIIEDHTVIAEERLLEDKDSRFRDVLQGMDGALYALTDKSGILYRIGM